MFLQGMMRCLILGLTVRASAPLCKYPLPHCQYYLIFFSPGSALELVTTPRWSGRTPRSWAAAWCTTRARHSMRLLLFATMLKVETSKAKVYICILSIHIHSFEIDKTLFPGTAMYKPGAACSACPSGFTICADGLCANAS